jgi:hypothetical protein
MKSIWERLKKLHWILKLWFLVFFSGILLSPIVVPIVLYLNSYDVIDEKFAYVGFGKELNDSFAIRDLEELNNLMNYYCLSYDTTFSLYKCDTSELFYIDRIMKIPSKTPVKVIEYLLDSTLARVVFIDKAFRTNPEKKVYLPTFVLHEN